MMYRDLTVHCIDQTYKLDRMEIRPTLDQCYSGHHIHMRYRRGRFEYEICGACQAVIITEHYT